MRKSIEKVTLYYFITQRGGYLINLCSKRKDSTLKQLYKIPCDKGDSILILVEDYLKENGIEIKFDELIAI